MLDINTPEELFLPANQSAKIGSPISLIHEALMRLSGIVNCLETFSKDNDHKSIVYKGILNSRQLGDSLWAADTLLEKLEYYADIENERLRSTSHNNNLNSPLPVFTEHLKLLKNSLNYLITEAIDDGEISMPIEAAQALLQSAKNHIKSASYLTDEIGDYEDRELKKLGIKIEIIHQENEFYNPDSINKINFDSVINACFTRMDAIYSLIEYDFYHHFELSHQTIIDTVFAAGEHRDLMGYFISLRNKKAVHLEDQPKHTPLLSPKQEIVA